jgi:hypothetical protein
VVKYIVRFKSRKTLKYILSITLTLLLVRSNSQPPVQVSALPTVFLIGEYEDRYLELSQAHPAQFMSVYQNDIDLAYKGWSNCLLDMEDYASASIMIWKAWKSGSTYISMQTAISNPTLLS